MFVDLKHTKDSFPPNLIDPLCLRVTQVARSRDMATYAHDIDDNDMTDYMYFTPCACTRGKYAFSETCALAVPINQCLQYIFVISHMHEYNIILLSSVFCVQLFLRFHEMLWQLN